ncbi:Lipase 3 [Eumeta japonica]|uniref:Lipase 3 n=1 Tax=Eumeta variegata TaxID=151549 RepID=A0A4C1VAY2_EUMVA|nr:Lipase 3 [Eumeta japonica]
MPPIFSSQRFLLCLFIAYLLIEQHAARPVLYAALVDFTTWIDVIVGFVKQLPSIITENLTPDVIANILDAYVSSKDNEDIRLNITQLLLKYAHSVEEHRVRTEDGYILGLFHIPRNGSVVFLMHGMLGSSDDWVTAGSETGLAYLLSEAGYDVWLGNARGNKHSRRHIRLTPASEQFWDFTWDEIGRLDLPIMIDYVLKESNATQLKYIGHSQGTTTFFVMCSERPEYNEKVSLMVALSPVAWMSHVQSPLVQLVAPSGNLLYTVMQMFGHGEFLPENGVLSLMSRKICGQSTLAEILCNNVVFLICGFDLPQLNIINLPVIFSHTPSGAATKQLLHYGQGVLSGEFRQYDWGETGNFDHYGTREPPNYPVHKITAPVALFYSDADWLASPIDVQRLKENLGNVVDYYKVPFKGFNHVDFVWAKDFKELIFRRIMTLLRKY